MADTMLATMARERVFTIELAPDRTFRVSGCDDDVYAVVHLSVDELAKLGVEILAMAHRP